LELAKKPLKEGTNGRIYFAITMIQAQVSLVILFNFARWGSRSDFRLPPFNPSLHKYDCQAIIVGYAFIPTPGRLESHQYRTIVKRITAFYTFLVSQQFRYKRIADQKWGRTTLPDIRSKAEAVAEEVVQMVEMARM